MAELEEGQQQEQQGTQNEFDITSFNEALGFEFEDVGSLKEALSYKDKYSEYETKLNELSPQIDEWKTKYEDVSGKYGNVIDYFSGEDSIEKIYGSKDRFERVELEKNFPDKDPSVVSHVYRSDLSQMKDEEKILLADKLKYPSNLSDKERLEAIYSNLGIDDPSEVDSTGRYKITKAAVDAMGELKQIKDFKPEAPKFDFKAESEQRAQERKERTENLTKTWTDVLKKNISSYEGTKFFTKDKDGKDVETFSYKADDGFKEKAVSKVVGELTKAGLEVNDENIKIAMDYIDERHFIQNKDKIVRAAMEHARTLTEDEFFDEIHNTKEPNNRQAPPVNKNDGKMTLLQMMEAQKK